MDRKTAADQLNQAKELYQEYATKLSKAGATDEQKTKLLEIFKKKQAELNPADDLAKLNQGKGIRIKGGTVTPGLGMVGGKMPNLMNKLGAAVNVGNALTEGDPEDLISLAGNAADDVANFAGRRLGSNTLLKAAPYIGAGVEAVRSEDAGMSPEDEDVMLAEIQAQKDYMNSPAGQAAQNFKKLKGRIGGM